MFGSEQRIRIINWPKSKYLKFEPYDADTWEIFTKKHGTKLGSIYYWDRWGKYVITFEEDATCDKECLTILINALDMMAESEKVK